MNINKSIDFKWNGIKKDGILYKATYSKGPYINLPDGTITIYGKDYKPLPFFGEKIINESDMITDYFENDRVRILPNSPFYKKVEIAYLERIKHYKKLKNRRAIK